MAEEALRPTFTISFVQLSFSGDDNGRSDNVDIGIEIFHRIHTDHPVRECIGHLYTLHANKKILLDDNEANRFLSSKLSIIEIPAEEQPEIITKIVSKFRTTLSNLWEPEAPFPTMFFKIIHHMYLLHGEELIHTAKSVIDAFEELTLDSSDSSKEDCAICMEEFVEGIQVRRLPCSHKFHEDCIVKWLERSRLCPLCRFEMPTEKNFCSHDD